MTNFNKDLYYPPLLILAGGFGTRLEATLGDCPKALAPINGTPFLELQIVNWLAQGQRNFIFLLHHKAQMIVDYLSEASKHLLVGCSVRWVIEPTPLGTGGAVLHAITAFNLTGDFLLTNADTWLSCGFKKMSETFAPAVALCVVNDVSRYGYIELDSHKKVLQLHEKSNSSALGFINAGLYHLDVSHFREWVDVEVFSLEREVLPSLVSAGLLKGVELNVDFTDIGIPKDYVNFCIRSIAFIK
jgi:D-glycero-alpha-D-manno-heptose 1-phosphate guanylyltransferase